MVLNTFGVIYARPGHLSKVDIAVGIGFECGGHTCAGMCHLQMSRLTYTEKIWPCL